MKMIGVQNVLPLNQIQKVAQTSTDDNAVNFKNVLTDALNKVEATQKESDLMTNKLVTGEVTDIHQVMIASQKASLSLQLTVQVRNKVVEAYQEIMRMQV